MNARAAGLVFLTLATTSPAGAAPEGKGTIEVAFEGEMEKGSVALGGTLVSAWAPAVEPGSPRRVSEGALWILVRNEREPDGERTLLNLVLEPEPRLVTKATGLGGWMETLAAADLGAGLELAGRGRRADRGARRAPVESRDGVR